MDYIVTHSINTLPKNKQHIFIENIKFKMCKLDMPYKNVLLAKNKKIMVSELPYFLHFQLECCKVHFVSIWLIYYKEQISDIRLWCLGMSEKVQ